MRRTVYSLLPCSSLLYTGTLFTPSPFSLLFCRLINPNSFNLFSWTIFARTLITLITVLWILSLGSCFKCGAGENGRKEGREGGKEGGRQEKRGQGPAPCSTKVDFPMTSQCHTLDSRRKVQTRSSTNNTVLKDYNVWMCALLFRFFFPSPGKI